MLAYVRPWICDSSRFSDADRLSTRSALDRASGRNFRAKSNVRPLMTSRSMSQRMRFETSMAFAYRCETPRVAVACMKFLPWNDVVRAWPVAVRGTCAVCQAHVSG